MVKCGEGFEFSLRRPFSVHQIEQERLALLFKLVGRGTRWLAQCRGGDSLDLVGPLGKGFFVRPESSHLLLVAGGIGLAPLVFLAQKGLSAGHRVTLLLGAKNKALLYPQEFLSPGVHLTVTTEDGSAGRKGLVTELLPEFMPRADQVFACGPPPMYRTMAEMKPEKPVQVLLEQMLGCGVGACRGCVVKTGEDLQRVCREGPVFSLSEICW